jgi:hypothetical protein
MCPAGEELSQENGKSWWGRLPREVRLTGIAKRLERQHWTAEHGEGDDVVIVGMFTSLGNRWYN